MQTPAKKTLLFKGTCMETARRDAVKSNWALRSDGSTDSALAKIYLMR